MTDNGKYFRVHVETSVQMCLKYCTNVHDQPNYIPELNCEHKTHLFKATRLVTKKIFITQYNIQKAKILFGVILPFLHQLVEEKFVHKSYDRS